MRPAAFSCIASGRCLPALVVNSHHRRSAAAKLHKYSQTTGRLRLHASPSNGQQPTNDEEFEGLSQEDDWTVPGGYQDSLSSNTELGRAVQDACEELNNLSNLEKESLTEASKLLQKLGYKGDIFQRTNQPDASDE
ncbi:hypothetical protein WJX77_012314 [Trebouxia sp. C0004]